MPLLSRHAAPMALAVDREAESGPLPGLVPGARWPGGKSSRSRTEILRVCANPQCGTGWFRLWRPRETPVIEGGWCCSEACTEAQMRAAVSRELQGKGAAAESHRHRVPLGLTMLEAGWITQADLRAALAAQRTAGTGRLGYWLVRQRSASEEQVTRALGLQWNCPVLAAEFPRPEDLAALVPRLFVDSFGALPLRVAADKILYLGFEERPDPSLALAVERITGLRVESGLVEESCFRPAHERMLAGRFPQADLVEAERESNLTATLAQAVERVRPQETRMARVHDCLWVRMWLRLQRGPVPEPGTVLDLIASLSIQ
ncbi:MAG: hypothetical protein ABSD70_04460 [Terracidiphilus sp.]|jgi:hypothetical protein